MVSALLDFAAVAGVGDDAQLLGEVEHDGGFGARAVDARINLEGWQRDDREFGHVPLELVAVVGGDEHVPRKVAVPGLFGDDADSHAVGRVGPDEAVLHEQLLALQECLQPHENTVERAEAGGPVILAPPDAVFVFRLFDDVLVGRGTGAPFARVHDERAAGHHVAFAAEDGLFHQGRYGQVPEHAVEIIQAVVLKLIVAGQLAGLLGCGCFELEILHRLLRKSRSGRLLAFA